MKKLMAAFATTLFLVSPSFAAKKPQSLADVKCVASDKIEKEAASKNIKVEFKITGDDLKKLNAYVQKKNPDAVPPPGLDEVLILSSPEAPVWMGVTFANGCAVKIFAVDPDNFRKLMNNAMTDGAV